MKRLSIRILEWLQKKLQEQTDNTDLGELIGDIAIRNDYDLKMECAKKGRMDLYYDYHKRGREEDWSGLTAFHEMKKLSKKLQRYKDE
jgi:catalase (peroxidase I)